MSQPSDVSPAGIDLLFARARAGDQGAWVELVETCQPKLRRAIRRRLDPPMRSMYDSTDFANDVWKSLAAEFHQCDFASLKSLQAFLLKKAELKVIDEYRRQHAQKRDLDRLRPLDLDLGGEVAERGLASPDPTPSRIAVANETVAQIEARLESDEEREAFHLKQEGYTNEEIAAQTRWNIRKVQRFFQKLGSTLRGRGEGS